MSTKASRFPVQTYKSFFLFFLAAILLMSVRPAFASGQSVVPTPHEQDEDGFYLDKNGKILLAVSKGPGNNGYDISNLSIVVKRIKALELNGLQKVYFDRQRDKVIADVVVSERNARSKVCAAVMNELLEVVVKSNVKDAIVAVHLGEKWTRVEVDRKLLPKGKLNTRELGPRIAVLAARSNMNADLEQEKEKETDAVKTDGKTP